LNAVLTEQQRDPKSLGQLRKIASDIFVKHQIDSAAAKRAGTWTNSTWLAGGLVLHRVSRTSPFPTWVAKA
jgi:hypothetical protein